MIFNQVSWGINNDPHAEAEYPGQQDDPPAPETLHDGVVPHGLMNVHIPINCHENWINILTIYIAMHCYNGVICSPRDTTATAIMVDITPCTALHVSDLVWWSPSSPPCMVTNTGVLRLVTRGSTVSARARLAINSSERRREVACSVKLWRKLKNFNF